MDRDESTNEGGSSPDTVIARSSSAEGKKRARPPRQASGASGVDESSSSLDTPTGGGGGGDGASTAILSTGERRKRGRFGALRSSFREGGILGIRWRAARANESEAAADPAEDGKVASRHHQPPEDDEKKPVSVEATPAATSGKKKKKHSHSLVRRLSLSKFRLSSEQEVRQQRTPEGTGDGGRSRGRSPPRESPVVTRGSTETGEQGQVDDALERETRTTGELKRAEKLSEKPTKAVAIARCESPPLYAECLSRVVQQQDTTERQEERDTPSASDIPCSSTLPYALSKWPERAETTTTREFADTTGKGRFVSDPDSSVASGSSPVEVRRKLSLLEEKRAILQRRFFDPSRTTRSARSDGTVIAVGADAETSNVADDEQRERRRQISAKTFDAFSTFGEDGLSYLDGAEEDCTESYDGKDDEYSAFHAAMASLVGAVDHPEKSSSNNASNIEDEKREHLYKILVIGELGAGKTSIIKRYVHQFFSQHYRATIGVDFALKVLNWDPHTIIRLQLWDIAGQERFGNMTRVYYKEAVGAFIVFDVTRSATLDAVVKWKQDLDSKVQLPDGSPIPCVLLANKCDQHKEGLVNSPNKMDEYCKEKKFSGWFETSAKENINIEEAARFLVTKILQNNQSLKGNGAEDQVDSGDKFALNQSSSGSKKSCAC